MGWAGTGEAIASTRVVRNVSEACAPPVIKVCLDGDDEGTVAAGLITIPVRMSSTYRRPVAQHRGPPRSDLRDP